MFAVVLGNDNVNSVIGPCVKINMVGELILCGNLGTINIRYHGIKKIMGDSCCIGGKKDFVDAGGDDDQVISQRFREAF